MIGCDLVCGNCESCRRMFVFPKRGRTEEPTGVEGHGCIETGYACNGCGEMSADENELCIRCDTLEGEHPIVFCNVFMRACAVRGVHAIVYGGATDLGPGFGIEFGSAGRKFVCPAVHLNDARNALVSVMRFVPEADSRSSLEGLLLRGSYGKDKLR
jgi:hypothetical protein